MQLQALGKPITRYWQKLSGGDGTVFRLPFNRWRQYDPALADPGSEIPPLAPASPNSTSPPDTLAPGPPQASDLNYTHHLIRDFMFLHAAFRNATGAVPPGVGALDRPIGPGAFQVVRIPLIPPSPDDAQLPKFTRGTGRHQVEKKLLVQQGSVGNPGASTGDLTFAQPSVSYVSLLYKLMQDGVDVHKAPNWFGVAIPDTGVTRFTNVVIYFHPTPQQPPPGAGYSNDDYQAKTATGGHTNWKELMAYVDRLGSQLAGAIQQGASTDQIVIFPFMRQPDNRNVVETLINDQWYFIVRDILIDIFTNGLA